MITKLLAALGLNRFALGAYVLLLMVVAALWFSFQHEHHRAGVEQTRADQATRDWAAMRDAITGPTGWRAAYNRLEAVREAEAKKAAALLAQASAQRAALTSDAFDQGYAAGRAVGRKSSGAPNAMPIPSPARPAGGVRDASDDFAASWSRGAYRP